MIVVTGATGHIGNVVMRKLLKRGEPVRALTHSAKGEVSLQGLECERRRGSLHDPAFLQSAFEGASAVIHLAGMISILPGDQDVLHKINVEGTRNVLEACRRANVPRLVYTSTTHILRELPIGTPMHETIESNASALDGHYAQSKVGATKLVLEAGQNGMDAVVVFPSGVVGPFDFKPSEAGIRIRQILDGRLRFRVEGAYNFVDVRDVADGILAALDRGHRGECYTLSGHAMTMRDFFEIAAQAGSKTRFSLPVPYSLAYGSAALVERVAKPLRFTPPFTTYALRVLRTNPDIRHDKAKAALGYQARPIRESIFDYVKWLRGDEVSL